jgi:tRNA(Ile)-lysidine synthase
MLTRQMLLADRVLATIRKHGMLPARGRVLVALSGGPDSVGLLHLLQILAARDELVVAGAVHLNHAMRPAAEEDERFCRELAAAQGMAFYVERADVRTLAREWRTSSEDAGRRARHAFFARAVAAAGADSVATGHTLDDQAETFLLQMIRGAGPRGLSSISPRTGVVCRPLLEVRRSEVRNWLVATARAFRDDESNRDLAYTRNRVRHRLIPLLQQEFSPRIVEVLGREAAIARADDAALHSRAIEVARSVVLTSEDVVEVDVAGLRSLDPAIATRVAQVALARLAPERFIGFSHVEALLVLARGAQGDTISLPGQQARRTGTRIVLRRRFPRSFGPGFRVPLTVPGEVRLESQGWAVSAIERPNVGVPAGDDPVEDGLALALRSEGLLLPLSVRSRRRGDRLSPAGMRGSSKKLQDLFVDRKVPRELRDTVPLVVDGEDRILWVVGHAATEAFRVTEPAKGVLLLKARRLGGG